MATQTAITKRLAETIGEVGQRYSGGADLPSHGYLVTMTTYGALVTAMTALARVTRRPVPERLEPTDVLLSAAATHKLSRLLMRCRPLLPGSVSDADLSTDTRKKIHA